MTSLSKINEKYLQETNKYLHYENELSCLREIMRRSIHLSEGVDHLWRIKETEYQNVSEVLRQVEGWRGYWCGVMSRWMDEWMRGWVEGMIVLVSDFLLLLFNWIDGFRKATLPMWYLRLKSLGLSFHETRINNWPDKNNEKINITLTLFLLHLRFFFPSRLTPQSFAPPTSHSTHRTNSPPLTSS